MAAKRACAVALKAKIAIQSFPSLKKRKKRKIIVNVEKET
jgi:hypothetical protein